MQTHVLVFVLPINSFNTVKSLVKMASPSTLIVSGCQRMQKYMSNWVGKVGTWILCRVCPEWQLADTALIAHVNAVLNAGAIAGKG